jgi:hypothetical protein
MVPMGPLGDTGYCHDRDSGAVLLVQVCRRRAFRHMTELDHLSSEFLRNLEVGSRMDDFEVSG